MYLLYYASDFSSSSVICLIRNLVFLTWIKKIFSPLQYSPLNSIAAYLCRVCGRFLHFLRVKV